MVQNQPNLSEETCHTWELFQARAMTPPNQEGHVWAVPPQTTIHITKDGRPIPTPVQHPWRED